MIVSDIFSKSILWQYIFLAMFINCSAKPDIDKEHKLRVPNCGMIMKSSSSRIANANEANVHYPWVIQVIRIFKKERDSSCGGTIITKRSRRFQVLLNYIYIYIYIFDIKIVHSHCSVLYC